MKTLLLFSLLIIVLFGSCTAYNEVPNVKIKPIQLKYKMGTECDIPFLHKSRKTVSVQAFYMDQSEISSNDPRVFVNDTNNIER